MDSSNLNSPEFEPIEREMGPYWLLCRARFIKTKIIQIEPSPEKEVDQRATG
jgi:hypothetical protein